MATLTEVAYYTRKSVVYGGIGLAALILLRITWGVFSSWWTERNPPAPPPPTMAFGVLPELKFPEGEDPGSINLRLETITGSTPDLGSQGKVYFMPAFRANVLGLELATEMAIKLGFLFAPTRLDEQLYEWTREGELPGRLTVDLVTGHFSFRSRWYRDAEITTARAPSENQAVQTARNYLRSIDLLAADLATGPTEVDFFQAGADEFTPTVSRSEANFALVHLFRANIEEFEVVTSDPDQALVQVTVSGARGEKQVVEVRYRYSPVELERAATYPLQSTLKAWKQLQAGQGYIARLAVRAGMTAVRKIELGYYDSDIPQEFLQLVYVFTGDNSFVGYVPAVSEE